MSIDPQRLSAKYDVPAPRYTSYPTVPYWETTPEESQWLACVARALDDEPDPAAALYLHIPFCHSLCTYCGCNTRVTRNHGIVGPYIETLLHELDLYRQGLGITRLPVGELHLGGGTPTFLTMNELERLLGGLFERLEPRPDTSASIEVDPRVTTPAQLQLLARYGFRRISLGVQDFDPRVQQIVNRVQDERQVREVTDVARALGFTSVNYDLIYGLPLQTQASIHSTMDAVCQLRPDRIAFYAYAHVPWIKPGQRRFSEQDLPQGREKRALYESGRERLAAAGYEEIGLDHFALATDSLWEAQRRGTLHRNFMGYATARSWPIIGLGVSAIGDAGDAFAQNEKDLPLYQQCIETGRLPLHRGHLLTAEDLVLRRHILRLMTRFETDWREPADDVPYLRTLPSRLAEAAADGLIELDAHSCRMTERGRPFLRNICMGFDARLARRVPDQVLFSRAL